MVGVMVALRDKHQVLRRVVKFVVVDMVNGHTLRNRPVIRFPDDVRTETPHVRLGHLDEGSLLTASFMAGSDSYCSKRLPIISNGPSHEATSNAISHVINYNCHSVAM
jgi:hypothetical protein